MWSFLNVYTSSDWHYVDAQTEASWLVKLYVNQTIPIGYSLENAINLFPGFLFIWHFLRTALVWRGFLWEWFKRFRKYRQELKERRRRLDREGDKEEEEEERVKHSLQLKGDRKQGGNRNAVFIRNVKFVEFSSVVWGWISDLKVSIESDWYQHGGYSRGREHDRKKVL